MKVQLYNDLFNTYTSKLTEYLDQLDYSNKLLLRPTETIIFLLDYYRKMSDTIDDIQDDFDQEVFGPYWIDPDFWNAENQNKIQGQLWAENQDRAYFVYGFNPEMLNYSTYNFIYRIFENHVAQIYFDIKTFSQSKNSWDTTHRNIFHRFSNYAKKQLKVETFPDQTREWNHIQFIIKIRNAIIHSNGVLQDTNNGFEHYVTTSEGLEYINPEIKKIWIETKFIIQTLETFELFIVSIYKAIISVYPEWINHNGER